MSMLNTLGARLSALFEHVGINQSTAARAVGCSPGFLSEVVRGEKVPGADFLLRVHETYGVDLHWLLGGEGQMFARDAIHLSTFKLIGSAVELARTAILDDDKAKQLLIRRLLSPSHYADALKDWRKTHRTSESEEQSTLAATLYNVNIFRDDREERVRSALASAVSYFQARKEADPAAGMGSAKRSDPKESWGTINIGRSIRSAGRDYNEF